MTIQKKAKAYDEALERARKLYNSEETSADVEIACENIFPELKESEDEKIRKWLITQLELKSGIHNPRDLELMILKSIAWLEKQDEKDKLIKELGEYKVKYIQEVLEKHTNNISNKDDERLREATIAFLTDFAEQGYENAAECIDWIEKQSKNSRVIPPSFTFDDILALQCCMETVNKVQEDKDLYEKLKGLHSRVYNAYQLEKQGEQKPDWSEEDERVRKAIIEHFSRGKEVEFPELEEKYNTWIAWLEKQGESKNIEDSRVMLNACINVLRNVGHSHLSDWLEKQGKKPQGKSAREAINEEKVDNQNCYK